MKYTTRIACLLLAAALLLTACGGGAKATTMHLKRSEGTVFVADGEGKDVTPREDLGLYSGYGVDTQAESYAWIDLDEVKLTKMDQDSEIAITKEGKQLEIEVKSGSLFFNVTQSLAKDETLNIRTSSMAVGIRGTCGWVEVLDAEHMNVYLLEGKVECSAGAETAAVSAGEMGAMTEQGEITVTSFTDGEIPDFVREELAEEEKPAEGDTGSDQTGGGSKSQPARGITYSADATINSRSEYAYDEAGNLIESKHYFEENGTWVLGAYSEHSYNEQGRITEGRYYDAQGELTQIETLIENTEDRAVYHCTLLYEDATDGSDWEYTIYYDDQGKEIRQEESYGYTLYEYDEQGRMIRTDSYQSDGTVSFYTIFEYD